MKVVKRGLMILLAAGTFNAAWAGRGEDRVIQEVLSHIEAAVLEGEKALRAGEGNEQLEAEVLLLIEAYAVVSGESDGDTYASNGDDPSAVGKAIVRVLTGIIKVAPKEDKFFWRVARDIVYVVLVKPYQK